MAAESSKKSNIRWDEALKYKLAIATSKFRGYKQDDKKAKKTIEHGNQMGKKMMPLLMRYLKAIHQRVKVCKHHSRDF